MRALVILPTYNERGNISQLLDALLSLQVPGWELHALVIDDTSPDGTADVVREQQGKHGSNRLHLFIRKGGKAGRGSACIFGFRLARDDGYDAAVEMDTDLSHDPRELPGLLSALRGADVVVASKYVRGSRIEGWPWHRKILSFFANLYARTLLSAPIHDYTNGYRCYGMRALRLLPDLPITTSGFAVHTQSNHLLARRGMRFREVPTAFVNRRRGSSNMSVAEMLEGLFAVLAIRFPILGDHPKQFAKFCIVGFSGLFVDVTTLIIAVEVFDFSTLWGFALSASVATVNNFAWNVLWAFRDRGGKRHHQFMKFASLYIFDIFAATATAEALTRIGVWYVLSRFITIVIVTVWNYLMCNYVIFGESKKQKIKN
jgi:dolichol-phosphate mannosyltransferase